jgi:hypothetical protein
MESVENLNTCGLMLSHGSAAKLNDFSSTTDEVEPLERPLNPNAAASANIAAISKKV